MRQIQTFTRMSVVALLAAGVAFSQDSQTLGDAARQARQEKLAKASPSPSKDAPAPKTPKIITNDEIPAHLQPVAKVSTSDDYHLPAQDSSRNERKLSAEQWKSQIEGQKSLITSMQGQIDQLSESIRFAPANCAGNCAQWNQRQREKQQQVESMKAQLDDQQKRLEDMQEQARKQGYGSSVYEP